MFKVDSILPLTLFIIKILKLYPSSEETELENIFIKSAVKLVKELKSIWVLKTIVLLCQTVIKKMPLTPLLMPLLVPVDKDVWP